MMIPRGVQLLGESYLGDPIVHRGVQLMGTNEIENLQRALINLSVATQRPAVNVKITGVIDDQTMTAISAALGLLTEQLPTWLYLGLQGVLIAGTFSDTAKKYIGQYATQLALAANTAAVKYKTTSPPIVTPPMTAAGFFAPGWYKTPGGIALIVGGILVAFFAYRGLSAAPARRAA